MINRAYGALTDGEVTSEDLGYRYSDARRPRSTRSSINSLMSLVPRKYLGIFANLLIELLRSSPKWVDYVRIWDPQNTYQTEVNSDELFLELKDLSFADLVTWADSVARNPDEFYRTQHDPAVDRVCMALFSVITAGD